MSLAHIFWSRWQCSNAKVSQQKAELVHTFNSEFNITDPRGHTGFSSLGFHHTHTTSWATFTVKISAKNTPHWWTKGDFTLSLHASRFFPHVHKLRSKLHPGTYINTCFTTLFFFILVSISYDEAQSVLDGLFILQIWHWILPNNKQLHPFSRSADHLYLEQLQTHMHAPIIYKCT